jgi:hypothetical protein
VRLCWPRVHVRRAETEGSRKSTHPGRENDRRPGQAFQLQKHGEQQPRVREGEQRSGRLAEGTRIDFGTPVAQTGRPRAGHLGNGNVGPWPGSVGSRYRFTATKRARARHSSNATLPESALLFTLVVATGRTRMYAPQAHPRAHNEGRMCEMRPRACRLPAALGRHLCCALPSGRRWAGCLARAMPQRSAFPEAHGSCPDAG